MQLSDSRSNLFAAFIAFVAFAASFSCRNVDSFCLAMLKTPTAVLGYLEPLVEAQAFSLGEAQAFFLGEAQAFSLGEAQAFPLAKRKPFPLAKRKPFPFGEAQAFSLGEAQAFSLGEAQAFSLGEAQAFSLGEAQAFGRTCKVFVFTGAVSVRRHTGGILRRRPHFPQGYRYLFGPEMVLLRGEVTTGPRSLPHWTVWSILITNQDLILNFSKTKLYEAVLMFLPIAPFCLPQIQRQVVDEHFFSG